MPANPVSTGNRRGIRFAIVALLCASPPCGAQASDVLTTELPGGIRLMCLRGSKPPSVAEITFTLLTGSGWSAPHPATELAHELPGSRVSPDALMRTVIAEVMAYRTNRAGTVPGIAIGDEWSPTRATPVPGLLHWIEQAPGFQTGALDVIVENRLVDRIRLLRIDSARFAFSVNVEAEGDHVSFKPIDAWLVDLGAVAIVNGSYYGGPPNGPRGLPMTPTKACGRRLDRLRSYRSAHGAFFAEPRDASLKRAKFVDCRGRADAIALMQREDHRSYQTACFSHPVLVDAEGRTRARGTSTLRMATRAFLAEDRAGQVLIGQTEGRFFTLPALGEFLRGAACLDLDYALNLDGGSGSGMAARIGDYHYTNSRACTYESIVRKQDGKECEHLIDRNCDPDRLLPLIISVRAR